MDAEELKNETGVSEQNSNELDVSSQRKTKNMTFGRAAILANLSTQDEVNDALLSSVTDRKGQKLGEIMIELGYLTREEVEHILSKQNEHNRQYHTRRLQFVTRDPRIKEKKKKEATKKGPLAYPAVTPSKAKKEESQEEITEEEDDVYEETLIEEEEPNLEKVKKEIPPFMMRAYEGGKLFPALGYHKIDPSLHNSRPRYERVSETNTDNPIELLDSYGYTNVAEILHDERSSCYVGLSQEQNELVFIKHSEDESTIYTYYIELLSFLALEGSNQTPQVRRLIYTTSKGAFLVQCMLKGEALGDIITRQGTFKVDEALYIAQQLIDILIQVHSKGILHFDIKPQNILVVASTLEVSLLDFGCSVYLGDKANISYEEMGVAEGHIFGTPSYMACEQITKDNVSRAVDQVALGCILYRMITGRKLYAGKDVNEVLENKLQGKTEKTWDQMDDVPVTVKNIIAKAIAKSPEDRFKNMRKLGNAIMKARMVMSNNHYTKDLL